MPCSVDSMLLAVSSCSSDRFIPAIGTAFRIDKAFRLTIRDCICDIKLSCIYKQISENQIIFLEEFWKCIIHVIAMSGEKKEYK